MCELGSNYKRRGSVLERTAGHRVRPKRPSSSYKASTTVSALHCHQLEDHHIVLYMYVLYKLFAFSTSTYLSTSVLIYKFQVY